MISRCNPPILVRSIASSSALPPAARTKNKLSNEEKHADDPWAPVFEDIGKTVPPATSPRPHLSPRFFTSRPSPKTFFYSNTPRRHTPSGSGRREYTTDARRRGSFRYANPSTSRIISQRLRRQGMKSSPSKNTDDRNPASVWDHVFDGIDGTQPNTLDASSLTSAFPATSTRRPTRRKAMTAREISAFDNMFNMIFTAVSKSKHPPDTDASPSSPSTPAPVPAPSSPAPDPAETQPIGSTPSSESSDLFGKLRHHSNRMRRTSATEELLDRKREEMELCDTDHELLAWAMRSVFPEPSTSSTSELAQYLANPTYPHVLAHLMRTFRTRYRDPHTALALFSHAKRRSIHSYVFGCTTPAYNELLQTRWVLDGSLRGVEEALAEMRANGVDIDKHTRVFVERARREVGERMLGRQGEDGEGEVWDALERVEALVSNKGESGHARKPSKLDAKKRHWNEEWKTTAGTSDFNLGEDRLTLQP